MKAFKIEIHLGQDKPVIVGSIRKTSESAYKALSSEDKQTILDELKKFKDAIRRFEADIVEDIAKSELPALPL